MNMRVNNGTSGKQWRQNTKNPRQQPWQTTLGTTWKTVCIFTDVVRICIEFVRYKSINVKVNDNTVEVFVLVRCAVTKPLIQS